MDTRIDVMGEPSVVRRRLKTIEIRRAAGSAPRTSISPSTIAFLFLTFWTILNLAYVKWFCPFDLAPDEAHYWHWSRHLDWSYYSKGPLVAWLIRGSCELFGTSTAAVRLPAVFASTALLAGLYVLIADILRDRRVALAAILGAATLPGLSAGSVLITIDPPFLACWCWALVAVHRALQTHRIGWWLVAGLVSALGVLAKYPMLLLPVFLAGHFLLSRRIEFRRLGIWCLLTFTSLGAMPMAIWNAQNDWVSLRHVLEQAGFGEEPSTTWKNPLGYVSGQFALLLGVWFVVLAAAAWKYRRTSDPGLQLAWWASAPVWGVFFGASFGTAGQANWPAAAYIGGVVLAAAWLRDGTQIRAVQRGRSFLRASLFVGIVLTIAIRFPQLARPALANLVAEPNEANPTPIRKIDPTCRLLGWRTLAQEIDRLRESIRGETGDEPLVAGMTWTVPGELSFYCNHHPETYSFGPALADRRSQYDLWRPNPIADPEHFRGRTFLYVGEEIPNGDRVFDRVEGPIPVMHREGGIPVARWTIWVCRGFRGFPPRPDRPGY